LARIANPFAPKMPATEALEVAAFNFLIDCKSRRLSLPRSSP
jgi:hypothetical protein